MGSIFQVNESNGAVTITGPVDVGSHQIHSVTDPTLAQDAATKNYVDGLVNGLSWKNPVLAATTGTLTSSFPGGYTATTTTLTENTPSNGSFTPLDGVTLVVGNRVLIKNETGGNAANNGIYTVTTLGNGSSIAWVLTRSTDMNTWAEVPAAATVVEEGTVNADLAYVCTSDPGGTLGTTAITFVNFASISGGVTSITGTTNEVIASSATGAVTLSLPQAIATSSSPSFASETLSNTTNQLVLGTTHTVTISSTAPSASRTYTLPDAGGAANVVLDQGNYTIGGTWTFSNSITAPSLISSSSNPATAGVLRLADADAIEWRNHANSGNISLAKNTSDQLTYAGSEIVSSTGQVYVGNATGILPNANTTATSSPTANDIVSRDSNANAQINNIVENFTTTATAAGTTALTAASSPIQQFTGTTTQTVTLPDATTLTTGFQFAILNRSTGVVSVNNHGGTLQQAMSAGTQTTFTCTNTGTANGTWDVSTSSAGGSVGTFEYVNYVVGTASGTYTGSTTVFNLPFTYSTNGASLEVFYDGQQLVPSDDYTETSGTSVTTTQALVVGTKVAFRTIIGSSISAPVTLLRENYVVGTALNNYTGSTTVFNLVNSYNVGGNVLLVTLDGDVQTLGSTVDYLETNSTTVTFNNALVTGQKVSFIWANTGGSGGIVNAGISGQVAYYPSSTSTVSSTAAFTVGSTGPNGIIVGTNSNNNAATGVVGEFVSAAFTTISAASTGTFGDATSMSLTAGDWDVSMMARVTIASGTTATDLEIFPGEVAGNSASGQLAGNNSWVQTGSYPGTVEIGLAVPAVRFSLSTTTTIYFKYWTSFSGSGTPTWDGRISARRVR